MRRFIRKLLGGGERASAVDERLRDLLRTGAPVLDVRTAGEFAGGHVTGAVNVPLDKLRADQPAFAKTHGPVVVCCRSGARSARAAELLRGRGIDCVDGGAWRDVQCALDDLNAVSPS